MPWGGMAYALIIYMILIMRNILYHMAILCGNISLAFSILLIVMNMNGNDSLNFLNFCGNHQKLHFFCNLLYISIYSKRRSIRSDFYTLHFQKEY